MTGRVFIARKSELREERRDRRRRRVLGTVLADLVVTDAPRDIICESVVKGDPCHRIAVFTGPRGQALCGWCYSISGP